MNDLLIATTNPAKLAEFRLLLRTFALNALSLDDIGISEAPAEDGATFAENARLKAAFYFARSGLPTLADDGGLEVDALGGAPGVRSHRWLGVADPDDRMLAEAVIQRMAAIAPPDRTARLRAAGALVYQDQGRLREALAEASLEGVIADRCYPEVRRGFPYRSVLYLPDQRRYLAELTEEEAAQISQRRIVVAHLSAELARLTALA